MLKKGRDWFSDASFLYTEENRGPRGSHGIVLSQLSVVSGLTTFITDVLLV